MQFLSLKQFPTYAIRIERCNAFIDKKNHPPVITHFNKIQTSIFAQNIEYFPIECTVSIIYYIIVIINNTVLRHFKFFK